MPVEPMHKIHTSVFLRDRLIKAKQKKNTVPKRGNRLKMNTKTDEFMASRGDSSEIVMVTGDEYALVDPSKRAHICW